METETEITELTELELDLLATSIAYWMTEAPDTSELLRPDGVWVRWRGETEENLIFTTVLEDVVTIEIDPVTGEEEEIVTAVSTTTSEWEPVLNSWSLGRYKEEMEGVIPKPLVDFEITVNAVEFSLDEKERMQDAFRALGIWWEHYDDDGYHNLDKEGYTNMKIISIRVGSYLNFFDEPLTLTPTHTYKELLTLANIF